jgi:uncharacterized spore protein YtfJ
MPFEDVVKQVAETLEREGNARAVFGEPVKLETKTVIPVACVQLGGGGGGMRPGAAARGKLAQLMLGGGGGGGFLVYPVGFIHEEHGEVVFTPIHLDVKDKPLLAEASHGLGKTIDVVTSAFSAFARKQLGARRPPSA